MLEVVHILGLALLVGNLFLLEIRVFGVARQLDLMSLARLSLTLAAAGFSLAAVSGLLMFATQPLELLANRVFTAKMLLLMLAGCNAAWFHGRQSLKRLDRWAKAQMAFSMLIWVMVVVCGRWIGYV